MDARLERRLRALAVVVAAGVILSVAFSAALGHADPIGIAIGVSYGPLLSLSLGSITLLGFQGPMREWLAGRSFTMNVAVRSAIYAAIIIPTQWLQLGARVLGQYYPASMRVFWISVPLPPLPFAISDGSRFAGGPTASMWSASTRRLWPD
jgi:adenylate cyclase